MTCVSVCIFGHYIFRWSQSGCRYAARWYSVLLRREYWADSKGSEWNPQLWDCMLAFTGGNDEKRPGPWDEDNADCLLDLCCAYVTLQKRALDDCADVNAGLMLLLSQRSMTAMDERIPPPAVSDLIAEASRVRGVRQRTETHNELKAGISRAFKGFVGTIRRASSVQSESPVVSPEAAGITPRRAPERHATAPPESHAPAPTRTHST